MDQFLQAVASGVLIGAAYAILGVGFSLTWGATGVINASHAAFAVLGAYLGYFAKESLGVDPLLATIGIAPLFFVFGLGFYHLLVKPLKGRVRDAALASVVLTFGVAIMLENAIGLAFSADPRLLKTPYVLSTWHVAGMSIPGGQGVSALLAAVVLLVVAWFLYHTYTGRAVRAVEQEPEGAALSGVSIHAVNALTYGVALATAGVAGVALSMIYAFHPGSQLDWLVITFLVVILGGVGSVTGVAIAGLAAGLIVTVSTLWVPYAWVNLVLFTALIVTLLIRPTGLFAR